MTTKKWVPAFKMAPESLDPDKRTMRAIISTDQVDRDMEVIEPDAFKDNIDSFMANPVLLWMHDPRNPPLGKLPALEFFKDRVEADIQFRKAGDDQLADSVFSLYQQGILTSFSVGFRILPGGYQEPIEDPKSDKINPARITKGELFEVSSVTIPSNTGAVAKYLDLARTLDEAWTESAKHYAGVDTSKGYRVVAKDGPTVYGVVDGVESLKIAADYVNSRRDRLAKGQEVPAAELAAIQQLRVSLLGLAPKAADTVEPDVARALAELSAGLGDAVSQLTSPLAG